MRKLLVLMSFFLSFHIYAQKNIVFIDPAILIEEARLAFQDNDSLKAFQLINSINENDSLYMTALFNKADMLLELGKYEELIELYNSFDSFENYNYSMKIYTGLAILRSEQFAKAVDHYKEMLELYPKSYLVYYNLAISYKLNNEIENAVEALKQSILYNPYYAPPHLELANICYQEDLISQALLCYDTYLLLNPTGANSLEVLQKIDEVVSTKNSAESRGIKISEDDNSFQDIDLLIKNYTALNKEYKTPNKIELPFVKQNHALFELLNQYEGNNGFWDQKYVKFYKQLFNSGYFNDFIYYITASTTNEKYKKIISKNDKNQKDFLSWAAISWMSIIAENNTFENKQGFTYSYFDSGEIQSLGKVDNENYYEGDCYYYGKYGNLRTIGSYENHERAGHWEWYYENGQKEEEANYINGDLNANYIKYTPEGIITSKANYLNNLYNGDLFKFNQRGVITEHSLYINDSLNGTAILYHNLGEKYKRLEIPYEKNKVNGMVKEYFAGGEKKLLLNFKNGQRDGEEQNFFINGKLLSTYSYESGELNGLHKEYYFDGNIFEEGSYVEGYKNNEWKRYYRTGQLFSTTNYSDKGVLSGLYEEFSREGNKILQYEYKNGDLYAYSFFSDNGENLSKGTTENNKLELNGFYSNGNIMVEGIYIKGERDGEWKYYNEYGSLVSFEKYAYGKISEDHEYFLNGNKRSTVLYNENAELDGYYQSLYIDGSVAYEGYYVDGEAEREWFYYYPDGTISDKKFYFHDDLSGNQYDYSVEGKLYSKNLHKDGLTISTTYYDTTGVEIDVINYYTDTTGILKYKNGLPRISYSYLNGYAHGEFSWYYFNGKIQTKGSYFNGDEHGSWKWYNDRGTLTSEGEYIYGNETGAWKSYYENGKPETIKNYMFGQLQGEYITYSKEGNIEYSANYIDDELNGEAKFYSPLGELQLIRYYDYGELIGYSYLNENNEVLPMIPIEKGTAKIKTYFTNGITAREIDYKSGEFHGYYKKYHNDGTLAEIDQYNSGIRIGESIEYFNTGQIKIHRNYLNGSLHGNYAEYYENGQIKEDLHFLNGSLSGLCNFYNEDGSLSKKVFYFNGIVYDAEYYKD